MGNTARSCFSCLLALLALLPLTCFSQTAPFNLPSQPLAESLKALGAQTNINVMVSPSLVDGRIAPAVKAELSAKDALKRLLEGTGLVYYFINDQTVVIREKGVAAVATKDVPSGQVTNASTQDTAKEAGKKSSQDFRVAQVDQTPAGPQAVNNQNPGKKEEGLSEIIVTAQKRNERLQDVPVPVTAVQADALVDSNQLRLQDYYTRVPGLNLTTADPNSIGIPILAIRGVTSAPATNPTVGIVVDDVPFGSSTSLGQGYQAPDINPLDLDRIEVLRGPQGTLYGADSIGGLVKFVTVDPSMQGVSGRVQASTSSIHNGAELGYDMSGAINVPLGDQFAVRASGFTRQDPGYVDDPTLHLNGVNEAYVNGGRLAALWQPSDAVFLKIS